MNLVYYIIHICSCGEKDITSVFGTVVGGSSPSRSTNYIFVPRDPLAGSFSLPKENISLLSGLFALYCYDKCGVGLVVEHDLAKVETGVRFSHAAQNVKKNMHCCMFFSFVRRSHIFVATKMDEVGSRNFGSVGGENICDQKILKPEHCFWLFISLKNHVKTIKIRLYKSCFYLFLWYYINSFNKMEFL
jgi:hypothetical protein